MRAAWGLAVADFRERTRRPGYLLMLLSAIGLGWLAVPAADAHWVVLDAGGRRGVYTGAYVGLVTALTSALWLTFVGFYLVRDTVARDERTGVGHLLASTPLRTAVYLGGKFLGNVLLLGSMAAALAATTLALQQLRGESRALDLPGLLAPYLFIALPMLAVTAAAAVLFETTPMLRGGLGNILWFFVWMVGAVGGQSPSAPLGGIGLPHLPSMSGGEFSLGLTYVDTPLRTFEWPGLALPPSYVGGRAIVSVMAVAVALLPALWFHRFDRPVASRAGDVPVPPSVYRGLPRTAPAYGPGLPQLFAGELRILVQGTPWWWWLGAALLFWLPLAVPPGVALALIWVWPVLLWSRLGTRTTTFLAAYPSPHVRLLASWAAGVAVTAALGALASWQLPLPFAAASLFVPALALLLGTLTGTPRTFQALYTVWWYLIINDVVSLNFMTGGLPPSLVGSAALGCLVTVLSVTAVRHARR
ncbi:hypothetical protein ABZS66_35845 [Dactylosporangium sp. NPDC005572]|uniref:hypothetical protein n=1 Tax=Dactylosporangium sp. NPDC005572 TaxID=3156889 RepID=UPI0033A27E8C